MRPMPRVILLIGLFWLACTHGSTAREALTIGYNQELVPSFYWLDKKGRQGIDAEIIQGLFKRSHLDYHMVFSPWSRLMHQLKAGTIDGACPGFKTPDREGFAIYLDTPLNYAVFSIFTRRGNEFPFKRLEDLYGKKIGINMGYSISPDLNHEKHAGKIFISEFYTTRECLNALMTQRIDAYAGNRDSILFRIKKRGIGHNISFLPRAITRPRPVYLMFSRTRILKDKHNSVILKLNRELKKMWETKIIDKITSRYIDPQMIYAH